MKGSSVIPTTKNMDINGVRVIMYIKPKAETLLLIIAINGNDDKYKTTFNNRYFLNLLFISRKWKKQIVVVVTKEKIKLIDNAECGFIASIIDIDNPTESILDNFLVNIADIQIIINALMAGIGNEIK